MSTRLFRIVVLVFSFALACAYASAQAGQFLVTNDDNQSANTATFYSLGTTGTLLQVAVVSTGGKGYGGGHFALPKVAVARTNPGCVFASNGLSGTIAGIVESTHALAGTFSDGSSTLGEIGLTMSNGYLYAGYNNAKKIGAFLINSDCTLQFIADVTTTSLSVGIKAVNNILVVAYGTGYIESFDISGGVPVSNGDYQQSTGNILYGGSPAGVEISSDSHWAIFGDSNAENGIIEVSDISSGKLATTVANKVGTGRNSNNVRLGANQRFIFVSNNSSGQVTAAFFNAATGVVSGSCTSSVVKLFATNIGAVEQAPTATGGGLLYLANWQSGISTLHLATDGSACKLTELPGSPAPDPQSTELLSIATFLEQ